VAVLVPGFIGLAGVAPLMPAVSEWLRPVSWSEFGLGPPIYAILAATASGMIIGCVRWLVIDHIHHWTGLVQPAWDLSGLQDHLDAFNFVVEGTYRYYQFYANTVVAVLWAYLVNRLCEKSSFLGPGTDFGVLILCAILFAGSRDALAKYYTRSVALIGEVAGKDLEDITMTNGFDHGHKSAGSTKTEKAAKSQNKPEPQSSKPVQAEVKGTQPPK